jgi:hypothetical protein
MNIEEAINNINQRLCELDIDSFKIIKGDKENNSFYKIARIEKYEDKKNV